LGLRLRRAYGSERTRPSQLGAYPATNEMPRRNSPLEHFYPDVRSEMKRLRRRRRDEKPEPSFHHHVYVVLLDEKAAKHASILRANPRRNPRKPCVYVGMSGLPPE